MKSIRSHANVPWWMNALHYYQCWSTGSGCVQPRNLDLLVVTRIAIGWDQNRLAMQCATSGSTLTFLLPLDAIKSFYASQSFLLGAI